MYAQLQILVCLAGDNQRPKAICSKRISLDSHMSLGDVAELAHKYHLDILKDNPWIRDAQAWTNYTIRG